MEKINQDDDIVLQQTENGEDVYLFDPYNPLNKLITDNEIKDILKRYGVDTTIYNYNLYKRAFIHQSYTKRPKLENIENNILIQEQPANCLPLYTKSNERLEFVGDGILECITKYYLYRRFPKENEGFMTEKKIALVKNESIGKLAYEMGLHKHYILSRHAEEKNTRTNLKKLGCLFESFLGALFLDYNKIDVLDEDAWFKNLFVTGPGFQMAQIFVESIFEKHVDWVELIKNDDNYKNILQVRIQKEFKVTPHYIELSHTMETGYTMGVFICLGQSVHNLNPSEAIDFCGELKNFQAIHERMQRQNQIFVFLSQGTHKIKRKAEQFACQKAIRFLDEE